MKTLLQSVVIAYLLLMAEGVLNSAEAAEIKLFVKPAVKPKIDSPRITIRPRNVKPQTNRLIGRKPVDTVVNPSASRGGADAEEDSPARSRAPQPLHGQSRAAEFPRIRPDSINIVELIMAVMKDGVADGKADKDYFLEKLKMLNSMSGALAGYLSEYSDAKDPDAYGQLMRVLQRARDFDPNGTGADTDLRALLTAEDFTALTSHRRSLAADPSSPEAFAGWEAFSNKLEMAEIDPGALVQWALRETYVESVADLIDYAEKQKKMSEQKQAIRDELSKAGTQPCEGENC